MREASVLMLDHFNNQAGDRSGSENNAAKSTDGVRKKSNLILMKYPSMLSDVEEST
jgi:hypothetical protein